MVNLWFQKRSNRVENLGVSSPTPSMMKHHQNIPLEYRPGAISPSSAEPALAVALNPRRGIIYFFIFRSCSFQFPILANIMKIFVGNWIYLRLLCCLHFYVSLRMNFRQNTGVIKSGRPLIFRLFLVRGLDSLLAVTRKSTTTRQKE